MFLMSYAVTITAKPGITHESKKAGAEISPRYRSDTPCSRVYESLKSSAIRESKSTFGSFKPLELWRLQNVK